MDARTIGDRASAVLGFDNISLEILKMSFEAEIKVKHMGDLFSIVYTDDERRVVLDIRDYTKEKDFLDALDNSKDAIRCKSDLNIEELKSKKIIVFDDPMCFESVARKIEKGTMTLFILLIEDDVAKEYYPEIKFVESKFERKRFCCKLVEKWK